jgi:peroxiredoxin
MRNLMLAFLVTTSVAAVAEVKTGAPAPEFGPIQTTAKNPASLSDYRGKIVVLEWLNHGCPFVKKHYQSGNMQALQKKLTESGVVWLSVVSSAPGKQGHVDAGGALREKAQHNSEASEILLDPEGKVGKLYGAKTTPHMYVIDPQGTLVYQGAIDDRPGTDQAEIKGARNYVAQAVEELKQNKKVSVASTKPYGCAVKY